MPAGLQAELSGLRADQQIVVFVLIYLFAPMYLIVPLMVASVIAADSFGGAVVIPILLLVVGQATGVMYFNVAMVTALGALLWLINAGLLCFGVRLFRRERLIAQT